MALSPIALSNQSGAGALRVPRNSGGFTNQGASLSAVKVPDNYEEVRIETSRLDDLNIGDVGFIKIDVEGFEQEVIEGARATIARDRPVILVEMEERFLGYPIEDAIGRVVELGYRGLALLDGQLVDLSSVDAERHCRVPTSRADYINNFIFVPTSVAANNAATATGPVMSTKPSMP